MLLLREDTSTSTTYKRGTFDINHGIEAELPLGEYLRESATTKITIWATGGSHDEISRKIGPTVTTTKLYLALPSSFSSLKVYDEPGNINFTCNAYGDMDRTVIFYFGDENTLKEINRFDLNLNSSVECTCKLPVNLATHGAHIVRIELWQRYLDGTLGLSAEPIQFEIAIKDGISETPIIWLGDYQDKYYSYDSIVIPYAIYNPVASSTDITFKKDNIQLGSIHKNIANTVSSFYKWEITETTINQMNYYQICCGDEGSNNYVQREISFKVEVDPDRIVEPVTGYTLYFNPKGRSNDETAVERAKWSQTINKGTEIQEINATFENFNWRNNGWLMDESLNTTYLKVSNGAKFTLPLGQMVFAGGSQSEQSHTIEMQLKISNNQLYSNLVSNVTRYDIPKYDANGNISYNEEGKVIYNGNDDTEYNLFTSEEKSF